MSRTNEIRITEYGGAGQYTPFVNAVVGGVRVIQEGDIYISRSGSDVIPVMLNSFPCNGILLTLEGYSYDSQILQYLKIRKAL